MSRSSGAGYPIAFKCTALARLWPRTSRDWAEHIWRTTGRQRPTKRNGKGHPRKSWTTFEWECSCGARGWSSHMDLERMARVSGQIGFSDAL